MNRNDAPRKQSVTPIVLSALVCPGAGQFLQRRWIAGVFFFTTFLAAFVCFMIADFRVIAAYYHMAFDFDAPPPEVSLAAPLPSFAVAISIYVIGLIDTAFAHFRLARKATRDAAERLAP